MKFRKWMVVSTNGTELGPYWLRFTAECNADELNDLARALGVRSRWKVEKR